MITQHLLLVTMTDVSESVIVGLQSLPSISVLVLSHPIPLPHLLLFLLPISLYPSSFSPLSFLFAVILFTSLFLPHSICVPSPIPSPFSRLSFSLLFLPNSLSPPSLSPYRLLSSSIPPFRPLLLSLFSTSLPLFPHFASSLSSYLHPFPLSISPPYFI